MWKSTWPLGLCMMLVFPACADLRAYQFAKPPENIIIPHPKLAELTVLPGFEWKETGIDELDRDAQLWRSAFFNEVVPRLQGWKYDLCPFVYGRIADPELVETEDTTIANKNNDSESIDKIAKSSDLIRIPLQDLYTAFLASSFSPSVWELPSVEKELKECQKPDSENIKMVPPNEWRQILTGILTGFVDVDHDRLLVSLDELMARRDILSDWTQVETYGHRPLKMSRTRSSTLALAILPVRNEDKEIKPFVLQLQGEGQEALIKLAPTLSWFSKSKREVTPAATEEDKSSAQEFDMLTKLLKALGEKPSTKPKEKNFEDSPVFDLRVSSVLNSPDSLDRFEYLTTYLYLYPFPGYFSTGADIVQEFWNRFKTLQRSRTKQQRINQRISDLLLSFQDLRVYIEATETTVNLSPTIELENISRKGSDKAALPTLKPELSSAQAAKGSVSMELKGESSVETTVTSKLSKQLDQRTVWLNDRRSLLRITQRGLEAINIAGTIKERVTLHVPTATKHIALWKIKDGKLSIDSKIARPLYSDIEAVGITLAVVREPYRFKRASADNFGLADTSDAFYVVRVSHPLRLPVFHWHRDLASVYLEELMIRPPQPIHPASCTPLLAFDTASNEVNTLTFDTSDMSDKESIAFQLKTILYDLTQNPAQQNPKLLFEKAQGFKKDGTVNPQGNYYYIVANTDVTKQVKIGKDLYKNRKLHPLSCDDIPYIKQLLQTKKICP